LGIVGWKGKSTIRAYVPRNERLHYLRLIGADTTPYEKNKFQEQRVEELKDPEELKDDEESKDREEQGDGEEANGPEEQKDNIDEKEIDDKAKESAPEKMDH
jgi:tRNA (cytosine34-C5)-methyltransferase